MLLGTGQYDFASPTGPVPPVAFHTQAALAAPHCSTSSSFCAAAQQAAQPIVYSSPLANGSTQRLQATPGPLVHEAALWALSRSQMQCDARSPAKCKANPPCPAWPRAMPCKSDCWPGCFNGGNSGLFELPLFCNPAFGQTQRCSNGRPLAGRGRFECRDGLGPSSGQIHPGAVRASMLVL